MKKKMVIRILVCLLAVILIACIGFGVIYFTRFRTLATLEKVTDYEDGYNLYTMTVKYDYSIDDVINSGYTDTQGFVDAVIDEALPLLPVSINVPSYGCSAFRTETNDGNVLMGRNYDFKLDTSALMVRCEPKDGYKSISFAALNNVGADHADASISKKIRRCWTFFRRTKGLSTATWLGKHSEQPRRIRIRRTLRATHSGLSCLTIPTARRSLL